MVYRAGPFSCSAQEPGTVIAPVRTSLVQENGLAQLTGWYSFNILQPLEGGVEWSHYQSCPSEQEGCRTCRRTTNLLFQFFNRGLVPRLHTARA